MFDVYRKERIGPYVKAVWERRSYVTYVAISELRAKQVNTVLGNLWHLLNPALTIAVYYLVFGVLLGVDRGVDNFILFLAVGVFVFQLTQRTATRGATSIVSNVGIIRAFRFPRIILPITSVVTEAIAALPTFLVMYVVALLTGQSVRWQWMLVPVLVFVQIGFNLGVATIAARATTQVRDISQILPFVFRLLFYGSGVIFNVSAYATGSREIWFILNPLYCLITLARWCVLGYPAQIVHVVSLAMWTLAVLVFGLLWFRAAENRYGRE